VVRGETSALSSPAIDQRKEGHLALAENHTEHEQKKTATKSWKNKLVNGEGERDSKMRPAENIKIINHPWEIPLSYAYAQSFVSFVCVSLVSLLTVDAFPTSPLVEAKRDRHDNNIEHLAVSK
jgi:hypothetical protein